MFVVPIVSATIGAVVCFYCGFDVVYGMMLMGYGFCSAMGMSAETR